MALFPEKLVSIARPVAFAKGARLARQGEASRGAFLIAEGRVEAQVALPGGGMHTVAEIGGGEMFGEMALIERGVCSATVVARGDVKGWFVEREDFRAMVASRDPAALDVQRAITRALAARLRALNAKLREHASAEDRPAAAFTNKSFFETPDFDWRLFLPLLPFFEGFDAVEIDELVAGCRAFEAARGAALFRAGERAQACYLVVRGAIEVIASSGKTERRVAVAGPGELVGYLALLEGAEHAASARVRESACILELPAARFVAVYEGDSGTAVRLQHAIHRSLLRSLARSNTQLTRLISHARLAAAPAQAQALETALHGQLWHAEQSVNSS
jgi:CRP-like cAMP-binding protein